MSDIIEYMVDSMVMDIGEELKDGVICVMYLNIPLHKIVYDDNTEDRYKESYNKDIAQFEYLWSRKCTKWLYNTRQELWELRQTSKYR